MAAHFMDELTELLFATGGVVDDEEPIKDDQRRIALPRLARKQPGYAVQPLFLQGAVSRDIGQTLRDVLGG